MADKAIALCGAPFCLHGRDEDSGLDCIGLAEQCLIAARFDCDVPNGYSIRGGSDSGLCEGDIILARPSPVQWHFLIRAGDGFVHAHAGLGKVVYSPGAAPWPIAAIFRLAED